MHTQAPTWGPVLTQRANSIDMSEFITTKTTQVASHQNLGLGYSQTLQIQQKGKFPHCKVYLTSLESNKTSQFPWIRGEGWVRTLDPEAVPALSKTLSCECRAVLAPRARCRGSPGRAGRSFLCRDVPALWWVLIHRVNAAALLICRNPSQECLNPRESQKI